MKQKRTLAATLFIPCLVAAIAITGCKKDKTNNDAGNKDADQYAIALVAGTGNAQTTYIQGLASFDTATLGNGNASELAGNGRMLAYNGAAYERIQLAGLP